jgi:serine/threonine-protein kinase
VLWKAQAYTRFHRWKEAEQAYEQLKKDRPNYWLGYHQLGVLLNAQGRYREALQEFEAAAAAAPNSALAFTNLGALQFKLGELAQAETSFRKSVDLKPNDLAYSNLADVLRARGQYSLAVQYSEKAAKLNPSDDQNWLDLGDSYEALGGRKQQALDAYVRAASEVKQRLNTDATDGSSWVRLALYQVKIGQKEHALPLLHKADTYGIRDLDTDLAKARVLELLNRRKDALSIIASCFRRGATGIEVSCIRDLNNLRKDPQYLQLLKQSAEGRT